ncbi:MAG: tetratricopeptide repeat protein [Bacteroidaceae bacterium]|nr:tetratricopeptide repeat protein [Bacteroidaceae bacterium]
MKKLMNFVLGGIVLFLFGCSSVGYVSFERLEAGDINYPDNIRRVGVVNNMPKYDFSQFKGDLSELPNMEGDGKMVADTLAYLLASADYFEEVVICDSMLQGENVDPAKSGVLSYEKADSLMEAMGVDLLFSVERVKIDLSVWNENFVRGFKSVVAPVLTAYIPARNTPWFVINEKDSIGYDINQAITLGFLQKDASAYAAYLFMEHLLPSWKLVERNYYASGNVEMRDANVYVTEQNWEEAYSLWKKVYDTKKGKQRMMAAFNLAVYHEAHDNPQQAIAYLEEAIKLVKPGSWDARMIEVYQVQLEAQSKQRQQLEVQMKRFE